MKKISLVLICSFLFIGYISGQSEAYLIPSCRTVNNTYKCGYINSQQSLIIPRIYDDVEQFIEGSAVVTIGFYSGTIDKRGSSIISMKFSSLNRYKKTNFIACLDGKYGIIDSIGKELLPFIYDKISVEDVSIQNQYLEMTYKGKVGLYNYEQKKWIIPAKYLDINSVYPKFLICKRDDYKIDWYNTHTLTIIDSSYSKIDYVGDNHFIVKKNNLMGIVDTSNNITSPIIYEELYRPYYNNHYLIAKKNNKYGFITCDNRVLIDFAFDYMIQKNYFLVVKKNNLYGTIDFVTHKVLLPCIYQELKFNNNQNIIVSLNNKYGMLDRDTNMIIIPIKYDMIDYDRNEKCFLLDKGLYYEVTFNTDNKPVLVPMQ